MTPDFAYELWRVTSVVVFCVAVVTKLLGWRYSDVFWFMVVSDYFAHHEIRGAIATIAMVKDPSRLDVAEVIFGSVLVWCGAALFTVITFINAYYNDRQRQAGDTK